MTDRRLTRHDREQFSLSSYAALAVGRSSRPSCWCPCRDDQLVPSADCPLCVAAVAKAKEESSLSMAKEESSLSMAKEGSLLSMVVHSVWRQWPRRRRSSHNGLSSAADRGLYSLCGGSGQGERAVTVKYGCALCLAAAIIVKYGCALCVSGLQWPRRRRSSTRRRRPTGRWPPGRGSRRRRATRSVKDRHLTYRFGTMIIKGGGSR
jgi:hypothetical protein